ncbi:MAG: ATP-binding cassette domain-containing protein [Planctomycetota bacterium]|nr:ATP-binding cassette domain-containing protein [Planctomycetota bacterium]
MTDAIRIRGLNKTFGPKTAVRALDLAIPQGSLYGFIGPNGAGKTTTIRMIMSIIFPDSGELSVLGKASAVESKDQIGYLPEERGLYRKMKVGAFLNYMGKLKGIDAGAVDRKVKTWLERVGLADCSKKKCEELSKGMQQKVQYIAAVLHEPNLIILDEPFSGLDPVNRRLLRGLIGEQHQAGRTLIFSTHAMFEAEQLCTHLFMIHKGNKVLDMPMDEVWRTYDPRTIIVEPLDAADADRAELWNALHGVSAVHHTDEHVELRLADNVAPEGVMEQLTRTVRLRRLELKKANLEEVFISLVGGDAAALRAEADELESVKG